jgi:hypothetical protein
MWSVAALGIIITVEAVIAWWHTWQTDQAS